MVEIKCTSSDTLPLNQLTEFQGGLKERTDEDIKEIIASIDDYGFVAPFFVWKNNDINYVLDGHGRLAGLKVGRVDNRLAAQCRLHMLA